MHVSIIVEPPRPPGAAHTETEEIDPFKIRGYERLASQIARLDGHSVEILPDYLANTDPPGFILLDASTAFPTTLAECPADRRLSLPARTVLLNADRTTVFPLLNDFGLAGAIDEHRLFLWTDETHPDVGYGLYGRCALAEALEADQIGEGPFRSGAYCVFGSERYDGLVQLLMEYLTVYARNLVARAG